MSDAAVFTKFEVYTRIRGGTIVAWELNPLFATQTPLTFRILVSRSAAGDFIQIGSVADTFVFEDSRQWIYGKSPSLHYQVRFAHEGVTYASAVTQAIGNLNARDTAIMHDMIRREELRQRLTGYCGYLYKRRVWGTRCTACVDYNTHQITNAACTTCYGTGFVGGYFDPVMYHVVDTTAPKARRKLVDPTTSMTDNKTRYVRSLKCPWLDTRDVWVDFDSDRRYVVQTVQDLEFRGITFVFDPVELRLAPATDIVYQLPRPEDSSSSSSSGSA